MFAAVFYFLALAGFMVAALVCLSRSNRASVEVDLAVLHTTSNRLAAAARRTTTDKVVAWHEVKATWTHLVGRCCEKALLKQKALYSWARTFSLCAALCLIGVTLEATCGEEISVDNIVAGFRHTGHVVASVRTSQACLASSTPAQ
jgi:hypothetical protein